jgi:hypothetical protein
MGGVVILGSVLMLSYETPPETMVVVGMKPHIYDHPMGHGKKHHKNWEPVYTHRIHGAGIYANIKGVY